MLSGNKMKLLIVGGTGVLSSAVVAEALGKGMDVSIINRGNRKGRIPAGVEHIKADIKDTDYIKSVLAGRHFDAVVDFLCYNKKQIEYSLELFKDVAGQYVFISTACVYDTSIPGLKIEDSPKGFKDWNYSTEKWECEQYLARKAVEYGMDYSIVRPCVTYDDTRIPYGIMPPYGYHWTLAARILNGKPVITWDGGKARWSMMRVEDFAVGVVGLVGNPKAYGEAFNICGDKADSWNEVLDTLGIILGREVIKVDVPSEKLKKYCPGRAGEIAGRALDSVIDNSKIKSLVPEFQQRISLEAGIGRTVEAYKKQSYQKGIDWRFDAQWDSIARKEIRRQGLEKAGFKTGFMNYIRTASFKDWLSYQKEYWGLFIKIK